MSFCVYRYVAHGICLYDYTAYDGFVEFDNFLYFVDIFWHGKGNLWYMINREEEAFELSFID